MRRFLPCAGAALFALLLAAGGSPLFAEEEHVHSSAGRHSGHDDEHRAELGEDDHGHHAPSPVEWNAELLEQSGIELLTSGPTAISVGVQLPGRIVSYEPNVAHIIPRFPGVIRKAHKHLGERVEKGDVLAVIESNQSLSPYEVRSPISGAVVKRHATVGEYASETSDIFVVADLSQVWGEFYVFPENFAKIQAGLPVIVQVRPLEKPIRSTISFVSRVVDPHTQSRFVRTVLANPEELLYPGAFAEALVVLENAQTKVAVRLDAVQRIDGREVVFVREKSGFAARPVVIGKRDKRFGEVLAGLRAGETYAAGNTFLIKAEIGKAEAGHSH